MKIGYTNLLISESTNFMADHDRLRGVDTINLILKKNADTDGEGAGTGHKTLTGVGNGLQHCHRWSKRVAYLSDL